MSVWKWLVLSLLLAVQINEGISAPDGSSIGLGGVSEQPASGEVTYTAFWTDGQSVGNLTSTASWQEISGITHPTLAANAGYLWAQSDGSVDLLLAIDTSDASNAGEWTLSGIDGIDYEDLSSAEVDGTSYVYLADMGNNGDGDNTRGTGIDAIIYRIVEPTITGSNGTVDAGDIEAINVAYPGGGGDPSHKDAETLLVDPDTGDMYIITKREAAPGVYRLAHQASYTGTQTLEFLGDMFDIPDVSSASAAGNAVGGNISPTGEEILIKSYNVMYLFPRDKVTETIYEALQATPTTVDGYVGGGNTTYAKSHPNQEPQGEAVTFDEDGINYYTASEFVSAHGSSASQYPLYKYTRLTSTPTTIAFQDGIAPDGSYAGTQDTYIWNTNGNTNYGTESTFVCDNTFGSDSRVGLLRFDLSAIPSDATIVGATLYLTIANEGQGWLFYRIINSDWAEGTVTWNNIPNGPAALNDTWAVSQYEVVNGDNLNDITALTVVNNMSLDTLQGWIDGTYNNHGWIIPGLDATDGVQFDSHRGSTAANRPRLVVRYTE